MRRAIVAMLWFACGCAVAQAPGGTVFEDGHGNGVRDAGEAGLAGVAVSDGRQVVRTDAPGRYALPRPAGQPILAIQPVGLTAQGGADGQPAFWFQEPMPDSTGRSLQKRAGKEWCRNGSTR